MKIVEYDDADSLGVLNLNLLSLGYALTPERVALIRRLDPRPFSFFAVYAVEDGRVAGQVGVYRLPMMSTEGPEDVGGVCAVCTHPAFSGRGIATRLLDEAHDRMRAAGLRFSTLGTARHRGAYELYRRQGYEDVFTSHFTFARFADVQQSTSLRAEPSGPARVSLADDFFPHVAVGRLGFARRSDAHIAMTIAIGDLAEEAVWLIWDGDELAGYALARISESILTLDDFLLAGSVDAVQAVAAIARKTSTAHVQVRINHPPAAASLARAGYPLALPGWSTFMVKPLIPRVRVDDARRLFGIGTDRFLMSPIDLT